MQFSLNTISLVQLHLFLQIIIVCIPNNGYAFTLATNAINKGTITILKESSNVINTRKTSISSIGSSSNSNNNNNNGDDISSSSSNPIGSTTRNVATQVLQGTGPALINLNKYNLQNYSIICKEWTANIVQKIDETKKTLKLGVKNDRINYVDTIIVQFPKVFDRVGMGINLIELVSSGNDNVGVGVGVGITVVESLVDNGAAATAINNNRIQKSNDSDDNDTNNDLIQPGDSLSKVSIIRTYRIRNKEIIKEYTANIECLSYDATVNEITNLPSAEEEEGLNIENLIKEYYSITLKRMRRKPKITIQLKYPQSSQKNEKDNTIELYAGENLRYGMLLRNVKLNDPLAKRFDTKSGGNCGANGLCRTCIVDVTKGNELLNPQRAAEKQILKGSPRWRLACKAIVGFGMKEGDVILRVNPRQWE